MNRVLIINGPNLNLLGEREPGVYGTTTLARLNQLLENEAGPLGLELSFFQSNHEGELIDRLHAARGQVAGIVLNPGGLSHTSVSLRDAVAASSVPVLEVHCSNLFAREEFRRTDLIAPVCRGVIMGLGSLSYLAALHAMESLLRPSG
jgi:3-dehydroquinate dehydratase II